VTTKIQLGQVEKRQQKVEVQFAKMTELEQTFILQDETENIRQNLDGQLIESFSSCTAPAVRKANQIRGLIIPFVILDIVVMNYLCTGMVYPHLQL